MTAHVTITGRYNSPRPIEVCWYYANWTNARCLLFYRKTVVMSYHIGEYPTYRHMNIKYKADGFSMAGLWATTDWTLWRGKKHDHH